MSESFGFIHSVLAPIFTKIGKEERQGWDQPRKKHDPAHRRPDAASAVPVDRAEDITPGEETSSTHIDLRI